MLIDTHCHLLSSCYNDVEEEIKKVQKSNVDKIIINGFDVKSSMETVLLAQKYDFVYAAVGIAPDSVNDVTDYDISEIERLSSSNKVVAIGEIGLDYYWTKDNKEKQIKVFNAMLKLAKEKNLPVIVHSRQSIKETYDILSKSKLNGIIHCYSGSLEMAREFIKIGFLIGIGGVVTFKNAKKLKDVVLNIDLENISLETDSPYLTPEPYRSKKNNPKYLEYIVSEVAKIKSVSDDEVIDLTSQAVLRKFDL